jgi:hypothetical protein
LLGIHINLPTVPPARRRSMAGQRRPGSDKERAQFEALMSPASR